MNWDSRYSEGVTMPLVKVTPKYQVTIPTLVRRKIGVGAGDVLEAKVEKGKITLTPKASPNEREYTPEQRRVIDMRLAKSLAEVKRGLTFGPFDTADEMIASMRRELKKRSTLKKPKPTR
jgi:AbrB family looped-hinge helix DNA binding protein